MTTMDDGWLLSACTVRQDRAQYGFFGFSSSSAAIAAAAAAASATALAAAKTFNCGERGGCSGAVAMLRGGSGVALALLTVGAACGLASELEPAGDDCAGFFRRSSVAS